MQYNALKSAAIMLVTPSKKTLMLKLNYGSYNWAIPGGLIDYGETPFIAAKRELLEETGIKLDLNLITDISSYRYDSNLTYVIFTPQKFNVKLSSEHTAYEWIDTDLLLRGNSDLKMTSYMEKSIDTVYKLKIL